MVHTDWFFVTVTHVGNWVSIISRLSKAHHHYLLLKAHKRPGGMNQWLKAPENLSSVSNTHARRLITYTIDMCVCMCMLFSFFYWNCFEFCLYIWALNSFGASRYKNVLFEITNRLLDYSSMHYIVGKTITNNHVLWECSRLT